MDNDKKEKIVAIVILTLLALFVSIVASIFGISSETIKGFLPEIEETASTYLLI